MKKKENKLTGLGSTFKEISTGFINLMQDYYDAKGKYPRIWGDYVYTDIGLNPADWANSVEGIIYKPGGKVLRLRPEEGCTFYMQDLSGEERELSSRLNWDLVYSMEDKTWYYHIVEKGNEIDISSLQVK